jgi:hypothetical protein
LAGEDAPRLVEVTSQKDKDLAVRHLSAIARFQSGGRRAELGRWVNQRISVKDRGLVLLQADPSVIRTFSAAPTVDVDELFAAIGS